VSCKELETFIMVHREFALFFLSLPFAGVRELENLEWTDGWGRGATEKRWVGVGSKPGQISYSLG
jgi:hypothetical protein